MKNRRNFEMHEFYCPECHRRIYDIPRLTGQFREKGHRKNLYCPWCQKITRCKEIRTIEEEYKRRGCFK